jgi:hypothetical protein
MAERQPRAALPSVMGALLPIMGVVLVGFLVIGLALPVLPLHVSRDLGFGAFMVGLVTGSQFAASLVSDSKSSEFEHFRDSQISGEVILPLGWNCCRPFWLDCARSALPFRTPARDAAATSR